MTNVQPLNTLPVGATFTTPITRRPGLVLARDPGGGLMVGEYRVELGKSYIRAYRFPPERKRVRAGMLVEVGD